MKMKPKKIKKILLTQPNYAWFSKRTWQFPPYTLCLLSATIRNRYDVSVFDPNFHNLSEEEVCKFLENNNPDVVGITSVSTEYFNVTKRVIDIVRKCLPGTIIIVGGVIPTVMIEESMKNRNVDFWMIGEGEKSLPKLIDMLQDGIDSMSDISGLAYWNGEERIINSPEFEEDLDSLPFPDYSSIVGESLSDYGNIRFKYITMLLPKNYPSAVTITSRGCPHKCIFCAGRTVSGERIRFRSAENVLEEIGVLHRQGVKEVIFLDDHFLADRNRSEKIMKGIIEKYSGLSWKCINVSAWSLDREILKLMYKSGCSYITVSIESGNQEVLKKIIKKPIDLEKMSEKIDLAKSIGFDLTANFVIGLPGETWEQIRDTFSFAERLNVDIVNFHIATPLPKTELMDICIKGKLLPEDYTRNMVNYSGYGKGLITTKEFTPFELEVLRSFEWDRINFSSLERRKKIARMNGITLEELEDWRKNTRRNLGVNNMVKNILTFSGK